MNNHSSEQLSGSALSTTTDTPSDNPTAHHRPRRWAFVAGAAALAVVASGSIAYAEAVKTVTLDVDGTTTTVTTVAGSVDGLLARQGIRTGERDVVAPAPDTELVDGAQIVVRYGRQVTVAADGQQSDVWLTVVDADEALDSLAGRGTTVSLVASRSGDRASLPLRLDTDGPVAVVADGTTRVVTNGSEGVDGILSRLKIELDGDDRVSVRPTDEVSGAAAAAEGSEVALVVQRVETTEVTTTEAVAFTTETRQDAERYEDLADVVEQEGADGVRTRVERVTTVDGAEESREMVSDEVTQAPVNKVVVEGTKERPVAAATTSTTTSSGATTGPVMAGSAREIGQQLAAARGWTGEQWTCLDLLFQRESGWNPYASNPSGAYGIPQALPGDKMATVAADWRTNPATQITWGLNYIAGRYGTPCGAWGHSESAGWY
ncbi:G5 domain-containing protein [Antribacter sp. KLBMP9083]|uniref:G5 domain-containing protein n=1 Tax=Antribacter soli TaxID=2910976 RepID=A0AA41U651_9MICO|nr:G5 domain-containing protein [Antribacter soli]MCF4119940.1 G5 domain-containing protein [Antribacter soli]